MVDFSKLLNRSPAQIEADQARIRQSEADLAARNERVVSEISSKLDELNSDSIRAKLTEWELTFVRSMVSRGSAFDPSTSLMGGRLTYLSDKEKPILERLFAQHLPAPADTHEDLERGAQRPSVGGMRES